MYSMTTERRSSRPLARTATLILLLLATLLAGGLSAQRANAKVRWLDRIVAIAGQEAITQNELEKEKQLILQQLRARKARIPEGEALDRQILERLILKRLQLQAAKRAGIRIDDQTLEKALVKIAGDNGMSLPQFRKALEKEGLNYVDFRNNIRDELTISALHERQINRRVNVSEQEVEDLIDANLKDASNKEYSLSHILVAVPAGASPAQVEKARKKIEALRQRILLGDDFAQVAIANSNGQHALEGGKLGWRKASQLPSIFANVVKNLKPGEVSEPIRSPSGFHLVKVNEIRGGGQAAHSVETLARHILIKSEDGEQRLEKIRQRILAGEDFAELAKKYSEDAGSAKQGGSLGWNFPGTFVPAFEAALASLKPGEISRPFKSRYGWHIVQLQDRRDATVPRKVLRERARAVLTQQKQEEELQLWLRRLRDESFVEIRLPGMDSSS